MAARNVSGWLPGLLGPLDFEEEDGDSFVRRQTWRFTGNVDIIDHPPPEGGDDTEGYTEIAIGEGEGGTSSEGPTITNATTGTVHNVVATDSGFGVTAIRFTAAGTATGFTGGADKRRMVVWAIGGDRVLANETGSIATQRILTGTGADITILQGRAALLQYDPVSERWRVVAVSIGPASPANSMQAADNSGIGFKSFGWTVPNGTSDMVGPSDASIDILRSAVTTQLIGHSYFGGFDNVHIGYNAGYVFGYGNLRLVWVVGTSSGIDNASLTLSVAGSSGGGLPTRAMAILGPNFALFNGVNAITDASFGGGNGGVLALPIVGTAPSSNPTTFVAWMDANGLKCRHSSGAIRTLSPYYGFGADSAIAQTGDIRLPRGTASDSVPTWSMRMRDQGDANDLGLIDVYRSTGSTNSYTIGRTDAIGGAYRPANTFHYGTFAARNALWNILTSDTPGSIVGGTVLGRYSDNAARSHFALSQLTLINGAASYPTLAQSGGGEGTFFFGVVGTAPSGNPTGGIAMWVDASTHCLKYRKPNGDIVELCESSGGGDENIEITNGLGGTQEDVATLDGDGKQADAILITASTTITGIEDGEGGRSIQLIAEDSGVTVTLKHLDGSADAELRVTTPNEGDWTFTGPCTVEIAYDEENEVWYVEATGTGIIDDELVVDLTAADVNLNSIANAERYASICFTGTPGTTRNVRHNGSGVGSGVCIRGFTNQTDSNVVLNSISGASLTLNPQAVTVVEEPDVNYHSTTARVVPNVGVYPLPAWSHGS